MPTDLTTGDRYRQLVELAPHAMVVVNRQGAILLVNSQLLAWFGYAREELLGKPVELLIPERFRSKHPEFLGAFAAKPSLRPMGTGRDLYARRKDGSEFPVDISLSPVETEDGLQVMASIADMSERKHVEIALQRSNLALRSLNGEMEVFRSRLVAEVAERTRAEQRFRQLVDLAPHAMVIVDREGTMLLVNSQVLVWFGYTRAELIGQTVDLLIPERFRARHPAFLKGFVNAPTLRPMGTGRDLFGRRKDGTEFPVDISLSPVDTAEGMQVIASIADITERTKADESVKQAHHTVEVINKELEAFAYSVSHDLRAPLRAMIGFANILLEEKPEQMDAEGREYLGRIHKAGERMGQLIDDMLTLSRITRADLVREPVSLSALAAELLNELGRADPKRRVDTRIEENLSLVADRRQVRILMDNLLGNAWKFSAKTERATIEVGAVPIDGGRAFFVRDNGAGFDMAYAGKLFGAFQRLHDMDEFPGTGIGLATAQRMVHRHGGRIWGEGAVGKGATFFFTL